MRWAGVVEVGSVVVVVVVGFSVVSVLRRGAVAAGGVVVIVGVEGTSPTSCAVSKCFVDVGEVGTTPSASLRVAGLLPAGADTPPVVGNPS